MLPYTIAIATRNRIKALELSIPRMLQQTRAPSQLIVVDSSDDHAPVAHLVHRLTENEELDVSVIHSERGLTKQRNRALKEVKHPIVLFPDDDSIWYPDVAEQKMMVYENDTAGRIAAVCGSDAMTPPADFGIAQTGTAYAMRKDESLKRKVAKFRSKFENRFFPDPAKVVGRSYYPRVSLTTWMQQNDVVPVEWMTGFRMSFRTDAIRQVGFCEEFSDYSLFEDIDASFGVWQLGAVVAARKARVYHHKSPERRGDGTRLGIEQLLNKAYIIAKYTERDHPARRQMIHFGKYKIWQYRLAAKDAFGKQRLKGAQTALKSLTGLLAVPPKEANTAYRELVISLRAQPQKP